MRRLFCFFGFHGWRFVGFADTLLMTAHCRCQYCLKTDIQDAYIA